MAGRAVVAIIAGVISSVGHASVLVDTGLAPRVSLDAAYDEYFTCDDDGCEQDYEFITSQASRFHVTAAGSAASITVAAAHRDGFDNYAIYRDTGGQLIDDATHRLWFSGYDPVPIASTALTGTGFATSGPVSLDTYDLGNLALAAGDYWIALSVSGPTFGRNPVLFAGTAAGTDAQQGYFDNVRGPYPYVDFAGRQASIRIDGALDAVTGVPEPTSWSLMLAGFTAAGFVGRWRKQLQRPANR